MKLLLEFKCGDCGHENALSEGEVKTHQESVEVRFNPSLLKCEECGSSNIRIPLWMTFVGGIERGNKDEML